jgi:hypothetical protein
MVAKNGKACAGAAAPIPQLAFVTVVGVDMQNGLGLVFAFIAILFFGSNFVVTKVRFATRGFRGRGQRVPAAPGEVVR